MDLFVPRDVFFLYPSRTRLGLAKVCSGRIKTACRNLSQHGLSHMS